MSFLAKWKDWVDNKAPPWLNLIITAGFHTAFTFAAGQVGLSAHAAFGYGMKEGGPFVGAVLTGRLKETYGSVPESPWTQSWVIADSIADVAGPVGVALLYGVGIF